MLCAQGSGGCAVQPLLPVSFLHPRSVLLYAVLQRLRGESRTPPGLLKLLARHREYIITPHSRSAQARAYNSPLACGDTASHALPVNCPQHLAILCSGAQLRVQNEKMIPPPGASARSFAAWVGSTIIWCDICSAVACAAKKLPRLGRTCPVERRSRWRTAVAEPLADA